MENKFTMVGKRFRILPEALNEKWRKPREAEVVDEDVFGERGSDVKYFMEVEGEKELFMLDGIQFLTLLKKELILPIIN